MPKKLNISSNERIDIPDFDLAANGFTTEKVNFLTERSTLDRRSRVLEGFRVQINGNVVTVWNGNAFNRDGQPVNDEDLPTASQSITLSSPNTTYFLEVEFAETTSDVDGRSFWDPTFDQPSPIPDGKEFALNVATRITPSWTIVSPVSTTGFQVSTNPNSVRIPVASLRTNNLGAGFNSSFLGSEFTLVNARTVLELDIPIGVASLRVLDSRLISIGQTLLLLDVGGSSEVVTVATNDIDNGIIGISGLTLLSHDAGTVVSVTTINTNVFVEQNSLPTLTTGDRTPRLFQGDEIRGSGILQSKEATSNIFFDRDDLNIRCEKDYKDFIAAQIREIKFGHPRSDVTSQVPPVNFASAPRHFDFAGGIAGARTYTITIGNGTTSFGDLNGTDETPFLAAVAQLATLGGGGRIYVKQGSYTFANTVNISGPVLIEGDGINGVSLVNDTAGALFNFNAGASFVELEFRSLVLLPGTSNLQVNRQSAGTLVFSNCDVAGQVLIAAGTGAIRAYTTNFGLGVSTAALSSVVIVSNSIFENCVFDSSGASPTISSTFQDTSFYSCQIGSGGAIGLELLTATTNVLFNACVFLSDRSIVGTAGGARLRVSNSRFLTSSSAGNQNVVDLAQYLDSSITNCSFATTQTGSSSGFLGNCINLGNLCDSITISGVAVNIAGASAVNGVAITTSGSSTNACKSISIVDCAFRDTYRGVSIVGTSQANDVFVGGCVVNDGGAPTRMQYGVYVQGSTSDTAVSDCSFFRVQGTDAGQVCAGIYVTGSGSTHKLSVTGCDFALIGLNTLASYGVANSGANFRNLIVTDCTFRDMSSTNAECVGVLVSQSTDAKVLGCSFSGLSAAGSVASGVRFSACNASLVQGCRMSTIVGDVVSYGVEVVDSNEIKVQGNNLSMQGVSLGAAAAIIATSTVLCRSLSFSDNTISLGILSGVYAGVSMTGTGTYNATEIRGNTITFNVAHGFGHGLLLQSDFNDCVVTDNIVVDTVNSIFHAGIEISAVTLTGSSLNISNNIVKAEGVGGPGTKPPGIAVTSCNDVVIANNQVLWHNGTFTGIALKIVGITRVSVTGNTVSGTSQSIVCSLSCSVIMLLGNILSNGLGLGNINLTGGNPFLPAVPVNFNYCTFTP